MTPEQEDEILDALGMTPWGRTEARLAIRAAYAQGVAQERETN